MHYPKYKKERSWLTNDKYCIDEEAQSCSNIYFVFIKTAAESADQSI